MALTVNNRHPSEYWLEQRGNCFSQKTQGWVIAQGLDKITQDLGPVLLSAWASSVCWPFVFVLLPVVTTWCPALGTTSSCQCPRKRRGASSKTASPLGAPLIPESSPGVSLTRPAQELDQHMMLYSKQLVWGACPIWVSSMNHSGAPQDNGVCLRCMHISSSCTNHMVEHPIGQSESPAKLNVRGPGNPFRPL